MVEHSKFIADKPKPQERGLTKGEIETARQIFGNSIDYDAVRISSEKFSIFTSDTQAVTPGNTIYMAKYYNDDYSTDNTSLFIHEMSHVWQWQNDVKHLSDVVKETIKSGFDYSKAYDYELDGVKDLSEYGVEQQASIIQSYYEFQSECPKTLQDFENDKNASLNVTEDYISKLRTIMGLKNIISIKDLHSQFCKDAENSNPSEKYQNYLEDRKKQEALYDAVLGNFKKDPSYLSKEAKAEMSSVNNKREASQLDRWARPFEP